MGITTATSDPAIGQEIGPLIKTPTNVSMFMYSAVTWLLHRIHYDRKFAIEHEGLPDVLAHGTLATDWLSQLLLEWGGPRASVSRLSYQIRSYMLPDEALSCGASVTAIEERDGARHAEFDVWIRKPDGVQAVTGSASVVIARNEAD